MALLLALLLSACGTIAPGVSPDADVADSVIYVVDRGWHTDISLPVAELSYRLAPVAQDFPGARYLVFGFADRSYLADRQTNFITMIRALLPDRGVILVTGLKDPPDAAFGAGNVVALHISATKLNRVDGFLAAYLATDDKGRPQRLANGPYEGSLFYDSAATYDGLHTCNTWVAEGLAAAGLPVTSSFVIFAWQVMEQTRALAQPQAREERASSFVSASQDGAAATRAPP